MPDNQLIFTKEKVHNIFCNMSLEQKRDFAMSCVRNGIKPEDLEETMTGIANAVVPVINEVVDILNYWSKEE